MIKDAIAQLVGDEELSEEDCAEVAQEILEGQATQSQIAAFITALRIRGEQPEHLLGFVKVMRGKAERIVPPQGIVLDTCGTGGDETGTFNISTAAAIIAAGAGVTVAKHGNRAITSACGSSDVLKALGVNVDAPVAVMERCLHEIGLCFMFAPKYHGAMKHAAVPRQETGIRTIFNMLGPLSNPAGATHQLVGVFDPRLTEIFAEVLGRLGTQRALIVHGSDGLDEITTTTTTTITELDGDEYNTQVFDPDDFGLSPVALADLLGGDAETNAEIMRGILTGQWGEMADAAILNAGAAIYVAEKANSIREGMEICRETIEAGTAFDKLKALIEMTNAG